MKSKIVILGGGGHARNILEILKRLPQYEILGYTDIKAVRLMKEIPYLGTDKQLSKLRARFSELKAVIGVGQISLIKNRAEIYRFLKSIRIALATLIAPTAMVASSASIGEGTVVMDGVIVYSHAKIGKNCILNTRSVVEHDCQIGNHVHVGISASLCGGVKVNDFSLIGAGAIVIQGKKITQSCLIGAGSVVVEHCQKSGVYLGVPAKMKPNKRELNDATIH